MIWVEKMILMLHSTFSKAHIAAIALPPFVSVRPIKTFFRSDDVFSKIIWCCSLYGLLKKLSEATSGFLFAFLALICKINNQQYGHLKKLYASVSFTGKCFRFFCSYCMWVVTPRLKRQYQFWSSASWPALLFLTVLHPCLLTT